MPERSRNDELWRKLFSGELPKLRRGRHLYKFIPANPRCRLCNVPFRGVGWLVSRMLGKGPSNKNPNFCNVCETMARTNPGGAETNLTLLFADVRGSTTLAENMSPSEYSRLMNRFYVAANDVLVKTNAFIDKLVGDEVIALFVPVFAGPDHARVAIHAAEHLLRATGHGKGQTPWIPVGVGIHTGRAYVGVIGSEQTMTDFTALGDDVNVAARLSSKAKTGEILISEAAFEASQINPAQLEQRQLELKGKTQLVGVRVMRVS